MTQILFVAYASDCLVQGTIDVSAERLSDFVNERDEVALRNVAIQAHEDGRVVQLDELVVDLEDAYAAEGSPRSGSPARRLRTKTARMDIDLAPTKCSATSTPAPGADPLDALIRRKPMVPVTGATIAFELGGEARVRDVSALIVKTRESRVVRRTRQRGYAFEMGYTEFGIGSRARRERPVVAIPTPAVRIRTVTA